jgi:hypothetical protein
MDAQGKQGKNQEDNVLDRHRHGEVDQSFFHEMTVCCSRSKKLSNIVYLKAQFGSGVT